MSGLSPASLIALQSYGAGAAQRQQHQHQSPPAREPTPPAPRFTVEDTVTLRAPAPTKKTAGTQQASEPDKSPAPRREDGVGRREAVHTDKPAYKRPGSLVDVKA